MSTSRNVRDSFLYWLRQNLPAYTLWTIRQEFDSTTGAINAEYASIKMNAVNVQFVADTGRSKVSSLVAAIDLVFQDELTAVDAMDSLRTILGAAGMIPLMDFSSGAPTATGGNVFWNPDFISFKPVADRIAFRRTCSLSLYYQAQPVPGLITAAL